MLAPLCICQPRLPDIDVENTPDQGQTPGTRGWAESIFDGPIPPSIQYHIDERDCKSRESGNLHNIHVRAEMRVDLTTRDVAFYVPPAFSCD